MMMIEESEREYPWMSLPENGMALYKMHLRGNRHPAMKMALIAIKMRRSPKQAFILLLGLTGAGKSSTINNLFDTDIAPTSDNRSESRESVEYMVTMQSNEWRIPDLTMSIIDTPGFGDTDGIEQDSKNIMSIKYFLQNHPHIKNTYPNLVAIVMDIRNNRISGPKSQFEQMLKGISQINAIDTANPNVVVILTHVASLPPIEDLWMQMVQKKKEEVKTIIRSRLGVTPEIVVQENQPTQYCLPKDGDWYILKNGEKQPKTLFQACKRILITSNDELGHEAIAVCFRQGHGKTAKIGFKSSAEHVSSKDAADMRTVLLQSIVKVSDSEVCKMLDDYKKRKSNLDLDNDIIILQVKLRDLNISAVKHIHNMTMNTLASKMYPLQISDQMEHILEDVFGMKYEQMKGQDYHIGSGYKIFSDSKAPMKPIDLKCSEKNRFELPANVEVRRCNIYDINCQALKTSRKYIEQRLKDLNVAVDVNIKYSAFNLNTMCGYNVEESSTNSQGEHVNQWSFAIEHKLYKIEIKQPYVINPELIKDIKALPKSYNLESEDSVNTWKSFFDKWGYYVITGSYIGGSLTGHVSTEGQNSAEEACDSAKVALESRLSFLRNQTAFETKDMNFATSNNEKTSQLHSTSIQWTGGDKAVYKNSWENIEANDWKRWVESLDYSPAPLWKSLDLFPLYHLAEAVDSDKARLIQKATNLALTGQLTFSPNVEDNRETVGQSKDSGGCFHGGSTILLHNGITKRISDISVLDHVLTMDENGFIQKDVIISWIHKVPNGQFKFLKITHDQGTITTTPEHIIFVGSKNAACLASSVVPGDQLHFCKINKNIQSSTLVTVLSVKEVTRTGLYAPLTLSGRLLVDGVNASCYCSLRSIIIAEKIIVSGHIMAHFGFLPLRLAHRLGMDVRNKIDSTTGIHVYAKWLQEKLLPYLP